MTRFFASRISQNRVFCFGNSFGRSELQWIIYSNFQRYNAAFQTTQTCFEHLQRHRCSSEASIPWGHYRGRGAGSSRLSFWSSDCLRTRMHFCSDSEAWKAAWSNHSSQLCQRIWSCKTNRILLRWLQDSFLGYGWNSSGHFIPGWYGGHNRWFDCHRWHHASSDWIDRSCKG